MRMRPEATTLACFTAVSCVYMFRSSHDADGLEGASKRLQSVATGADKLEV